MKTLYMLRHAKSSWSDPVLEDFNRPLALRGIKAAGKIARVLDGIRPRPEIVLCSSAVRATQTCEIVTSRLGRALSTTFLDDLYGAGAATLLNTLRNTPRSISAVLLIGHNPGLQELVVALTENEGGDAARQVGERFPTAALAVLRIGSEWKNIGPEQTTLERLILPRALERH
ncbi:MAG: histidine phosphatase family protein [Acidimicrobiales bacterium]